MEKLRLDLLLVERGLAESRSLAQRLVMAGQVRVNGEVELKPSTRVTADAALGVEHGPRYVSRGGEKLEAALRAFHLTELGGKICADIGASTGGFTDCLLQHGAGRVFAVDVGYGELHWKLRNHAQVTVMERTNGRNIQSFSEPIELVTIDASFISLRILLPPAVRWFGKRVGRVVALIKPQFEAGRQDAARGEGVIRDPAIHRKVLSEVLLAAEALGFGVQGLIRSPLLGPKGNAEFLVNLVYPGEKSVFLADLIEQVLSPAAESETAGEQAGSAGG
jgi:23S rRNA (cytidine1920-2'-O)/16S rRNA (cytidine1409-2'-O)-methyltransferase